MHNLIDFLKEIHYVALRDDTHTVSCVHYTANEGKRSEFNSQQ